MPRGDPASLHGGPGLQVKKAGEWVGGGQDWPPRSSGQNMCHLSLTGAQRALHSSFLSASCPRASGALSPGPSQGGAHSTGTTQPGVQNCAKQPASPNRWQSRIAIHHSRKWPAPLPVPQTNGSTPPSLPQSLHLPPLPGSRVEPFTQRALRAE